MASRLDAIEQRCHRAARRPPSSYDTGNTDNADMLDLVNVARAAVDLVKHGESVHYLGVLEAPSDYWFAVTRALRPLLAEETTSA